MSETTQKTEAEKRETLAKIVKNAQTAFFVTDAGGLLHGRPMANARLERDMTGIWFATRRNSGKIAEIGKDQHVLLGYTNATGSEWASVAGSASIVEDRQKVKEIWSPMWENWFNGPEDPNILLIRVTPTSAEYWDSGSIAISMVKFALAAVTGKKFDEGENERVAL